MRFAKAADTLFRFAGCEIDYFNGMIASRSSEEARQSSAASQAAQPMMRETIDSLVLEDRACASLAFSFEDGIGICSLQLEARRSLNGTAHRRIHGKRCRYMDYSW
jgi:hypothetical protein